jgi:hypothetical protein
MGSLDQTSLYQKSHANVPLLSRNILVILAELSFVPYVSKNEFVISTGRV